MGPDGVPLPRQPTVAEKRARAAAASSHLAHATKGSGEGPEPVRLGGHKIADTFWGKSWCRHLESYSDFANRLPRGRSYLRAGAVVDLKIAAGKVRARVAGSRIYDVEITIRSLPPETWQSVVAGCGGRIDSMVALLEGRLSDDVMRVVTHPEQGLFPEPRQIAMTCSCPDWAGMCKHVAASLYGVGARLDRQPELLFVLRGVEPADLVHAAAGEVAGGDDAGAAGGLAGEDLGQLFGIDLAEAPVPAAKAGRRATRRAPVRSGLARLATASPAVPTTEKPGVKRSPGPKPKPKPKPRKKAAAKPTTKRPPVRRLARAAPSPLDEFLRQVAQLGRLIQGMGKRSTKRKSSRSSR